MRFFSFLFIPIFLMTMPGCFGGGEINIDTPPPIVEAKRVVVAPFLPEVAEAGALSKNLSINLANHLKLLYEKEMEWIHDESNKVRPVSAKLEELGLTLSDIYEDAALAAKVGQAFEADMIILGGVSKAKLDKKDFDERLIRHGRQSTAARGGTFYLRSRQTALGKVRIKVIEAASGELLYSNPIRKYLKYWFAYQTQQSGQIIFKEPVEMEADLGRLLPRRIAYLLDKNGTNQTGAIRADEDQIMLKPDIILKGTGGMIEFN